MYYKTCSNCGAHLDPGEHCDCDGHEQPEIEEAQRKPARIREAPRETYFDREAAIRYRRYLLS